jgi:hypothetical protein
VGRDQHDATAERPDRDAGAVVDRVGDAGDAGRVVAGADDAEAGQGREQILIPADVVEVMMGGEDRRQADAAPSNFRQDGLGLGAVDDARLAAGRVYEQVGVVVGELRDGDDFQS